VVAYVEQNLCFFGSSGLVLRFHHLKEILEVC
jgi:hypothetical protein